MDNSIARNVTKEIMKECTAKKVYINEHFVLYFVNLLLLDPNWGITSDFVSSRQNVNSFIGQVITVLEAQQFPKIVTLQMQFYYNCNMELMDTAVFRQRMEIKERLLRLKNDILKTTEIEGPEQTNKMHKKIVSYITLHSGLGNPTIEAVYKEALKAFNSIMDENELLEFLQLPRDLKEEELDDIRKIVCGIRLFNKDCYKGGEGIEDLPGLLKNAVKYYKEELQKILSGLMQKVNLLTTIIDKCFIIQVVEDYFKMGCTLPPEIADVYMENIKDLLILYRQYELIIRKLMDDMEKYYVDVDQVCNNFEDTMKTIHETVYMRIAIPAHIIFPLFMYLSEIWTTMQDLVFVLSKFNHILTNLETFSKYTFYNSEIYESIIQEEESCTDAERLKETACLTIESENEKVQILRAGSFPNIDQIPLEYLGFCCWKMVETEGGLIPGNPNMGVAKYEDKYYVFSTPRACIEFSKKPRDTIMRVLELARKKPQLIHFLRLKEQMEEVMEIKQLTVRRVIKTSQNKAVQSLEFSEILPENIDRTYKWNIWDLKREAIMLANLSKCKTVSAQTWKTPSRNAIRSQTYEKRDKNLQTKKDNYSNVPRPSNFIYGLRGRKDDQQFIIDLTRPVEE